MAEKAKSKIAGKSVSKGGLPKSAKSKSKSKMSSVKKSKTSKSKPTKTVSKKKISKNTNENIIAVCLVALGVFLTLSLTTEAMGIFGSGLKLIFKGLFGNLSVVFSLCIVFLGGIKLVYQDKLSFKDIPKTLYVLIVLDLLLFYGIIGYSNLPLSKMNLSMLGHIFEESSQGLNIGLITALLMTGFDMTIGKMGAVVLGVTVFAIIIFYYFKVSPKEFAQGTKTGAGSVRTLMRNTKNRVLDFVTEEVEEYDEELTEEEKQIIAPHPKYERLDKYDYIKKRKPISMDEFEAGVEEYIEPVDEVERPFEEAINKFSMNNIDLDENDLKRPFYEEEIRNFTFEEKEEPKKENIEEEKPNISNEWAELGLAPEIIAASKLVDKAPGYKEVEYGTAQEAVQNLEVSKNVEGTPVTYEDPFKEYVLPPAWLLKEHASKKKDMEGRNKNAHILEDTLRIFGVEAKVVNISVGPTITRYELQPKPGTKVSKIVNLSDDLSLALAAESIRIEAPIPGKPYVGIEVSNKSPEMVGFKSVVDNEKFRNMESKIGVALGKDVTGSIVYADLSKMPHLLVAGSTGSGKSVCINTIICSILMKAKPNEVKFIMIDPKVVELSVYNEIGHLLIPVVTDMKKAPYALNWAVNEMEKRYKLFAEQKVRDINGYNEKFPDMKMPRIVILVDELADLMMVSPKEVEDAICRLAQKARACGMHLVIATQRPSVDVITGLIKANIPSRISFAVSSAVDSRTILDIGGAEKLLGKGDMLYAAIDSNKPLRVQGAFISDKEVSNIVSFVREQAPYRNDQPDLIAEAKKKIDEKKEAEDEDPLLQEIIEFALDAGQISTSLIQRKFRIGFNRAARITEELEARGIIGPPDGGKPRKVIATRSSIENKE